MDYNPDPGRLVSWPRKPGYTYFDHGPRGLRRLVYEPPKKFSPKRCKCGVAIPNIASRCKPCAAEKQSRGQREQLDQLIRAAKEEKDGDSAE